MDFQQAYDDHYQMIDELRQRLAASQERERVLREALTKLVDLDDTNDDIIYEDYDEAMNAARRALAETEVKP